MRILQLVINKRGKSSLENEMVARALIKNPAAVITAIGKVGRSWLKVMDNIKDWVEVVSIR